MPSFRSVSPQIFVNFQYYISKFSVDIFVKSWTIKENLNLIRFKPNSFNGWLKLFDIFITWAVPKNKRHPPGRYNRNRIGDGNRRVAFLTATGAWPNVKGAAWPMTTGACVTANGPWVNTEIGFTKTTIKQTEKPLMQPKRTLTVTFIYSGNTKKIALS